MLNLNKMMLFFRFKIMFFHSFLYHLDNKFGVCSFPVNTTVLEIMCNHHTENLIVTEKTGNDAIYFLNFKCLLEIKFSKLHSIQNINLLKYIHQI